MILLRRRKRNSTEDVRGIQLRIDYWDTCSTPVPSCRSIRLTQTFLKRLSGFDIRGYRFTHFVQVDCIILMNQFVAHSCDRGQGISSCSVRNESDSLFTASPMTSNWCKIADCVLTSLRKARLPSLPLNCRTDRAGFSKSTRMALSRDIIRLSCFQDSFPTNVVIAALDRLPIH